MKKYLDRKRCKCRRKSQSKEISPIAMEKIGSQRTETENSRVYWSCVSQRLRKWHQWREEVRRMNLITKKII